MPRTKIPAGRRADKEQLSWFRVRFPDVGAGATSIHSYVQGKSPEDAREVASQHEDFQMYDTTSGEVNKAGDTLDDIALGLCRGGPNKAVAQSGETIQQSDVEIPDTK